VDGLMIPLITIVEILYFEIVEISYVEIVEMSYATREHKS
jgi:hypothetical protein